MVQTLVKISLLILYHRLFHPSLTIRRAIYVMGAIVLAWFVAEIFANTFRCIPVSYLWNKQQSGHCLALLHFAYQDGILNMLLDFSILCMPFPMIYRLHTDIQTRLSLAGIFVLGFLYVLALSYLQLPGSFLPAVCFCFSFGLEKMSADSCSPFLAAPAQCPLCASPV